MDPFPMDSGSGHDSRFGSDYSHLWKVPKGTGCNPLREKVNFD